MTRPHSNSDLTAAEYLMFERQSEFKHEFLDGAVIAMARGDSERHVVAPEVVRQSMSGMIDTENGPNHDLAKSNLMYALESALTGTPCRVLNSDLRVKIDATGLYTYPDASVICDELQYDDERSDTVLNPTVLVEVLSPSTEAYDRGRKFNHYRQIESLREYLLVCQDEPRIERFFKNAEGSWVLTEAAGRDGVLHVSTLGIDISLREVFDKVEFDPIEPPPKPPI